MRKDYGNRIKKWKTRDDLAEINRRGRRNIVDDANAKIEFGIFYSSTPVKLQTLNSQIEVFGKKEMENGLIWLLIRGFHRL